MIGPDAADEWNYLAHATALTYGRTDYRLEVSGFYPPNHAVGPAIVAFPVMFAFSFIDRIQGHPVVYRRTKDSLRSSWTGFAFGIATQLTLVAGAALLYGMINAGGRSNRAAATVAISILASGLLYYAYRRPVSSHVYEFAIITLALYMVWREPHAKALPWLRWMAVGITAAMIFLVRYNNLPLAAAFIWSSLSAAHAPGSVFGWTKNREAWRPAVWLYLSLAAVVAGMAIFSYEMRSGEQTLWNVNHVDDRLLTARPITFYVERLFHVFFGGDWSLFVTAPLVILGLSAWRWFGHRRHIVTPLYLALLANLAVVLSWGTQASGYGYRYLVPAALPLATLGLSIWIERGKNPARRLWICAAVAVVPALLLLVFDSLPELSLRYGRTKWANGWVNNSYLWNALTLMVSNPGPVWDSVVSRSGLSVVGDWVGLLDTRIALDQLDRAKLVLVWLLPAAVGCAGARIFDRKPSCRAN